MYERRLWKVSACQTVVAFSKHSRILFKVSSPACSFQSNVLLLKGLSIWQQQHQHTTYQYSKDQYSAEQRAGGQSIKDRHRLIAALWLLGICRSMLGSMAAPAESRACSHCTGECLCRVPSRTSSMSSETAPLR